MQIVRSLSFGIIRFCFLAFCFIIHRTNFNFVVVVYKVSVEMFNRILYTMISDVAEFLYRNSCI